MARRDFTVNAMARRLADGALLDPFGGRRRPRGARAADGHRPTASSRTRCGSCAACGSSRSSGSRSTDETLAQMRTRGGRAAPRLRRADRWRARRGRDRASCRSSCSAATRRRALRLARDTGVLVAILPEFEPAIGYDLGSPRQPVTARRAPLRGRRQARRTGTPLDGAPRGAAPRPREARSRSDGADARGASAPWSHGTLCAGSATRRASGGASCAIVAEPRRSASSRGSTPDDGGCATRRFLAATATSVARDLVAHKRADLARQGGRRRGARRSWRGWRDELEKQRRRPAPGRRPRGHGRRRDRGRGARRARGRRRAATRCSTGSSTSRRSTAATRCSALLEEVLP